MKFSIVMPTLNQRVFIKQALDSVLSQHGNFELELIVVDGASTDGTLDVIRSIDDRRLKWRSAKDNGQADALRQGLTQATGDLIGWLNSDDLYYPGAFDIVRNTFQRVPAAQWLVGRCQVIDAQGQVVRSFVTRYKDYQLRRYSYRRLLRENFVSQPAIFWRHSFGEDVGPPDEGLHWTMDYDLWLRIASRANPLIIDNVLAQFRIHRRSKCQQLVWARFQEEYRVAARYCGDDARSRRLHWLYAQRTFWTYRLFQWLGV